MMTKFHLLSRKFVFSSLLAMLLIVPISVSAGVDPQVAAAVNAVDAGDVANGLSKLDQMCNSNNAEACLWNGRVRAELPLVVPGLGRVPNLSKAMTLLKKSCDLGHRDTCNHMEKMKRECENGKALICMYLSTQRLASDSASDREKAFGGLKDNCSNSKQKKIQEIACIEAARYLAVKGEHSQAGALLQQACDAKVNRVCEMLEPCTEKTEKRQPCSMLRSPVSSLRFDYGTIFAISLVVPLTV